MAQQPADDGLEALRSRPTLTDEERAAIRNWVAERVRLLVGSDPSASQRAAEQLRAGSRGEKEFRDAYVQACVEIIGSEFRRLELTPAARLVALVGTLGDTRTIDLLLSALQDERAGVRAAAAAGLRNLQTKLAGNADMLPRVIDALREAGRKEKSATALRLIYQALNYSNSSVTGDRRLACSALLTILDDRLRQTGSPALPADGADGTGLQVAWALRESLDEASRRQYATIVARWLHYAVRRYTGPDKLYAAREKTSAPQTVELRNSIELLIAEAEKQLTALLTPPDPPKVVEQMQRADLAEMVAQMNRWSSLVKSGLGLELEDVQKPTQVEIPVEAQEEEQP